MRLSDLLGAEVVTDDGARLGRVRDVRLPRSDGPGSGRGYVVDGLMVGKGSLGARLGLDREHMRSAWILRVVFGRGAPASIPWAAVRRIEPDRIHVDATAIQP